MQKWSVMHGSGRSAARHAFLPPRARSRTFLSLHGEIARAIALSDNGSLLLQPPRCTPWNKGKLIGAKPPLRPKHVWAIRTRLMVEGRTRDLAMFNLAIDSKLRGCYVVALKVEGIAPNGYAIDRAMVRQRKTGRPVKFELTDQTRQAADDYLRAASKVRGQSGRSLPDVPQQLRADIVAKVPNCPTLIFLP